LALMPASTNRHRQLTMPDLLDSLAAETKRIADLGFMACTAGNSSALLAAEPFTVAMSQSGDDKTRLTAQHFIRVGSDGRPLDGDQRKPSDETMLHVALYRSVGCGAVMHGHPPHAVALSLDADAVIAFRGIEMLKAFAGTTTHDCTRSLPVIENSQDMAELSAAAVARRDPHVPAILVRGHGVYAWGRTPAEAARHLETVEWLCRIVLLSRAGAVKHL
jgi:methylthioribulose-1-phosphate dehydratase